MERCTRVIVRRIDFSTGTEKHDGKVRPDDRVRNFRRQFRFADVVVAFADSPASSPGEMTNWSYGTAVATRDIVTVPGRKRLLTSSRRRKTNTVVEKVRKRKKERKEKMSPSPPEEGRRIAIKRRVLKIRERAFTTIVIGSFSFVK